MNILDKITETEYAQIDAWRAEHTTGTHNSRSFCSSRELLSKRYAMHKYTLFKMFGETLILSRPVSLQKNFQDLEYSFESCFGNAVFRDFFNKIYANWEIRYMSFSDQHRQRLIMGDLFTSTSLARNKWIGEPATLIPGEGKKEIKIQIGMKITSILKQLAKALGLEEEYEKFRIWHSQILNDKTISGTLHLSIHPLDYMTMSDNTYGWSSCMSWKKDGCYRHGTVEMMNSPYVVIAYLTGEKNDFLINGTPWSNKKWRSLYVVNSKCIASIKNYPYQNEILNELAMDWIKELAEINLGWGYDVSGHYSYDDDHECPIDFSTEYMYNDFGALESHYMYINEANPLSAIHYSGESQCMYCGKVNIILDEEGDLICNECNSDFYCSICGEYIGCYNYRRVTDANGDIIRICHNCYHESSVSYCYECGCETISSLVPAYIPDSPGSDVSNRIYRICQRCIEEQYIYTQTDQTGKLYYAGEHRLYRHHGIKVLGHPIKLIF